MVSDAMELIKKEKGNILYVPLAKSISWLCTQSKEGVKIKKLSFH